MAVSKRMRYEVLRRDNHTCRYCGGSAPDVKLTVDHVVPVALGGSDDPTNLVAACKDCNAGKTSTSPDAPLVADIDAKAAAWDLALTQAIEARAARQMHVGMDVDYILEMWSDANPHWAQAPQDAETTVEGFIVRGLNANDLEKAIDVATSKPGLAQRSRWSYFCGICWNMVREIEAEARTFMGASHGA